MAHGQGADHVAPRRADPDEWDEQTMLNLAAPMRLTRHLVPEMVRRPVRTNAFVHHRHVTRILG